MSTPSPRPPLRSLGSAESATSGGGSRHATTNPQRAAAASHSSRTSPEPTARRFGSPSSSTHSSSPPGLAACLPPLQSSRNSVPLESVVAAHATTRTRAQPVASPQPTAATTSVGVQLSLRSMLAARNDDDADDPIGGLFTSHAATAQSTNAMSPSIGDVTMMPPSPAYTIAPDHRRTNSQSQSRITAQSTSLGPDVATAERTQPVRSEASHQVVAASSSSPSPPPAYRVPLAAFSARRPGETPSVPHSTHRAGTYSSRKPSPPPALSSSASARVEGSQSARLAQSVRKATKSWLRSDEAAPLPNRRHLAGTAVTVQDEILDESGAARRPMRGLDGMRAPTTQSRGRLGSQLSGEGFTHILDMAGTTARSYLGHAASDDDGGQGDNDNVEGLESSGSAMEPFAMTAPASTLLLTTDSGARYGATITSLTDLLRDESHTPRAGLASLMNTLTPPPSPGVYIAPDTVGRLDGTFASTQVAPPRWAGTLTSDRQRDHPRELRLNESRGRAGAGSGNGGRRLPPIDATASELAALSGRSRRDLGLTDTWISTVRGEEREGAENSLDLARALFYYVIRGHPSHHLFVDGGTGQMTSLAAHVAVSSLLLDQLVVNLPRHHTVLIPYVQLLLRHIYVPDTPGVRDALGGTVMDEAVLDGLMLECQSYHEQRMRVNDGSDLFGSLGSVGAGAGGGDATARGGGSTVARAGASLVAQTSPEALMAMLLPYARKPFFLAHLELSQRVVGMAHTVRCREAHFQRLPLTIDKMQSSWSKSLLRTVLRLWSRLCRDRRLQERKLRQRWARRWAAERLSTGVRRWREYASDVLKTAEASTILRRRIGETKGSIERLNANAEAMRRKTHELNKALLENEVERQRMTLEAAATEQTYKAMLERVREMDQVGTSLLEGLLLAEPLPARGVAHSGGGRGGGGGSAGERDRLEESSAPEAVEATSQQDSHNNNNNTSNNGVMVAVVSTSSTSARLEQPLAYLGSMHVMLAWANQLIGAKGVDTELLCLLPASPDEEPALGGPSTSAAANAPSSPKLIQPDEAELRAQLMHTFDTLLDPAVPLTRIPLYKYLVLMRAFGEDDLNVPTLAVTRLVKAADEAVQEELSRLQLMDEASAASSTPTAPPASSSSGKGKGNGGDAHGAGGTGGGTVFVPLMERLPASTREAAEQVTRILVDCYEQLTGTACVTTAEQLFPRRRQVWLVFLAGLFRHYTNWIIRKGQSDMANLQAEMDALDEALDGEAGSAAVNKRGATTTTTTTATTAAGSGSKADDKRHLGRRHPKHDTWFYPPHQHRRWPLLVQQQQEWIAESLNALHCAVAEAQRSEALLTLEEQESWGRTLQCIPVTALSDLLPSQANLTSDIYVSVLRVVERHYSRLRTVFGLYAIPYGEIVADRMLWLRRDRERRLREMRRVGATVEELAAMRRDAVAEEDAMSEREFIDNPMLVMPVHAFWALLRTAGVAGYPAERNPHNPLAYCPQPVCDAFTTLHRPAVFSIVEHVTQRVVLERFPGEPGASAAAATTKTPANASFSGGLGLSPRRSAAAAAGGGQPQQSADEESEATRRRGRAVCFLGTSTVLRTGCYTRAVQEGRHVDLREDRGVLCLTLPQFLEALVRCVHAWVSLNAHSPAPKNNNNNSNSNNHDPSVSGDGGGDGGGTRLSGRGSLARASHGASARGSLANEFSGEFSPFLRDAATPSRGFASRQASFSSATQSGNLDVAATATTPRHRRARRPHVLYEPYVDDQEALQPVTVELVLRDFLLPSTLGARSIAATPFDLASRSPAILRFFARHHEALYKVFEQFSEPVEAQGMVRALPPPLCHCLSEAMATATTRVSNAAAASGRPDTSSGGAAAGSRPTTARRQSSASRRSSTLGAGRDVGIVSVLTAENAVEMARQLQWASGGGAGASRRRRLVPAAIQHCLVAVVADQRREGEVLFFSEFPQFLCAVAHFVDPNPFTALEDKVQKFVQERILNVMDEEEDGENDDDDLSGGEAQGVDTLTLE